MRQSRVRNRLEILVTAGPTVEPLDPVRFLSNRSSGRMGYAIASEASALGHRVTLVSGPTALKPPAASRLIPVGTALEMRREVLRCFRSTDVVIMTAAVADYRPVRVARDKIKKKSPTLTLRLRRNPDILRELGRRRRAGQVLVGFAAETRSPVKNALKKIHEKNLDWIALNDVSRKDIGFGSAHNAVTLIGRGGERIAYPRRTKRAIARLILGRVLDARG